MARVLLVDDEKVARALYGDFLRAAGHEVTVVGGVADAKRTLASTRFDAMVTDLLMPEGDGMELLQSSREEFPEMEVLVITALDKVGPAVSAIKSGAAEYLVKPVEPEALQYALSRALATRQLLRENASLRAHVQLLETGQRIATLIDKDQLLPTAGHAFQHLTRATAVLLFERKGPNVFAMQGVLGLEPGPADALAQQLPPLLVDGDKPLELSSLPPPYVAGWAFPAADPQTTWGYAVLLFAEKPQPSLQSSAIYLSRHLALAWRNLGRFAEVEDLAYLDDLTHLFNVRYLTMTLDREVKAAQQTQSPFSVLFLDLDYFKTVNDTHGHLAGSKLLVEAGRVLKSCVRDNDVVARYGGDEYVVLLRATDSGGALKVADRIRRTVETHQFLAREGYSVSLTTCIGVASFPEHAQDKSTLLDFADRAMYRGKKSSRNVVYMAASGLEATPLARHSAADA